MKRDGTPETWLEAWVLESGLGRIALATGVHEDLTKAQSDKLVANQFDIQHNPQSYSVWSWIREETPDHRLAGAEPRTQPEADND